MSAFSSVLNIAGALGHYPADGGSAERRRQTIFVTKRLAFGFAALACVPFVLAYRGAPSGSEMLVFASSLAPLAAAIVAARTGRLVPAHAIAILGLISLGLTLWMGLGCGAVCAITWLLAAHAEARSAGDKMLSRLIGGMTLVVLAGLLFVPETRLAPTQGTLTCIVVAGLALVYAWTVHADWWPADRSQQNDEASMMWRAISEAIDHTVVVFDATGSVVRSRFGHQQLLDLASHDVMGRGFLESVDAGDRPALLAILASAAHDDTTCVATVGLRTKHGPKRIEMRARRLSPCGTFDGSFARVVAILREAAEPQAETIETDAPEGGDKAGPPVSQLPTNMGHELRTPLNAIIGFSEILASRTLRPADIAKQQDYARIINQSGHQLLSVVNTILDRSKSSELSPDPVADEAIARSPEQRILQVA